MESWLILACYTALPTELHSLLAMLAIPHNQRPEANIQENMFIRFQVKHSFPTTKLSNVTQFQLQQLTSLSTSISSLSLILRKNNGQK